MESVSDQDQDGFEEGSNDEKHACLDEESDKNENEDSESEDNDEFENTDESDDDGDESDSDMDKDEDLACAIEEDLEDRELKNKLDTSNDVLSSLKSSSEYALESNGSLEVVPIYGDGNCLFLAIASGITTALISCERNEGGYPIDKINAAMEAKLASELRSKAVVLICYDQTENSAKVMQKILVWIIYGKEMNIKRFFGQSIKRDGEKFGPWWST